MAFAFFFFVRLILHSLQSSFYVVVVSLNIGELKTLESIGFSENNLINLGACN